MLSSCLRAGVLLLALVPLSAAATGPVVLVAGDPNGAHATVAVAGSPDASDGVVIETRRVGVAGSRLVLRIDRSDTALVERILTADDCVFDTEGSLCRVIIPGTDRAYGAIVRAFEAGLAAHVDVITAGIMEMRGTASLVGFRRALRAARG